MPAHFGLDIGSSSIKAIELSGNEVKVGAMVANPIGRLGVDLVPAEQASLMESIRQLISQNKIKSKKVVLGVPESLVYTRVLTFPFMSTPELATAIRWEVEQTIPFPIDKLELSWEVMYKPKNANSNEKMKVLVVAVPNKVASSYVSFMDTLGLEIERLENEAVSISRSVLGAKKDFEVDLVVDIGFSTTKMIVADNKQIFVNYVSPIAGLALTKIISEVFKLPVPQAEEYKRAYGLDKSQFEGKLVAAMGPVVNTLFSDVKKVIASYTNSYPERKLERIVLLGGSSFMRSLIPALVEQTGLEVVMGNVFERFKIASNLTNLGAIYATAVGLAMEVS